MHPKMAVEYHASTVTNMDIEDSKVDYKQLLGDGNKLRLWVYGLRYSPYKIATVCLGLLCLLLLLGVIGQSVHYRKVDEVNVSNLKAVINEKDNLQEEMKVVRKEKQNVEARNSQLQQNYDYLSKRKAQIETNNNLLTAETNKLKLSQSELETAKAALSKEIEQLRASRNTLDTSNNALSAAVDLLQKKFDAVVKQKNELQVSYDSTIKERDNLQNKFNNMSRSKNDLLKSYNDLMKDVEELQGRYNYTNSEKDKLEGSHQNLTMERNNLQLALNILKRALDRMHTSYTSLVREKGEIESSCKNVTMERNVLKLKVQNLTVERDYLRAEANKMNLTINEKKCTSDWRKFEHSCYYASVGKKTWKKAREYCQNAGGDLVIITSQSEMTFINSLYANDKEAWIGLSDSGVEGTWRWVDGSPLTLTFWGQGQPNSYSGREQDCVEVWHRSTKQGEWNDENCNLEQNWICEK